MKDKRILALKNYFQHWYDYSQQGTVCAKIQQYVPNYTITPTHPRHPSLQFSSEKTSRAWMQHFLVLGTKSPCPSPQNLSFHVCKCSLKPQLNPNMLCSFKWFFLIVFFFMSMVYAVQIFEAGYSYKRWNVKDRTALKNAPYINGSREEVNYRSRLKQ